jgi:transposase
VDRPRYNRDKVRYPSDLTDEEWVHIEPLIPPGKPGGGKRPALPKELPPRSTVHDYLSLWSWDGPLDSIHHVLYVECREKATCEAGPTACLIDGQSVKSAKKGKLVHRSARL